MLHLLCSVAAKHFMVLLLQMKSFPSANHREAFIVKHLKEMFVLRRLEILLFSKKCIYKIWTFSALFGRCISFSILHREMVEADELVR